MLPTPRQAGFIIGNSLTHMPLTQLVEAFDEQVLAAAGVERGRVLGEYFLLATAASLHAIESAGLNPEAENEAAAGLYDWMREQTNPKGSFLIENVETALEAYAQAVRDEQVSPKAAGDFSEVELEFIERLLALGQENELRARACCHLGAAAPATLWEVISESAKSVLLDAQLGRAGGA